jgi:phosphatidylinositol alpha-1,6-mannosyltransferase
VLSSFVAGKVRAFDPELTKRLRVRPGAPVVVTEAEPIRTFPLDGPIELLSVGRVHPRKGQLAVLEALATLPEGLRRRFRYHCVGPVVRRSYARAIRRLAKQHGIVVTGLAPECDLSAAYRSAHALVFPSQPHPTSVEGLGLVLHDAAMAGLPILASALGGITDLVRDGVTGRLFDPQDREALGSALRELVDCPERAVQWAKRAQSVAAGRQWESDWRDIMDPTLQSADRE